MEASVSVDLVAVFCFALQPWVEMSAVNLPAHPSVMAECPALARASTKASYTPLVAARASRVVDDAKSRRNLSPSFRFDGVSAQFSDAWYLPSALLQPGLFACTCGADSASRGSASAHAARARRNARERETPGERKEPFGRHRHAEPATALARLNAAYPAGSRIILELTLPISLILPLPLQDDERISPPNSVLS